MDNNDVDDSGPTEYEKINFSQATNSINSYNLFVKTRGIHELSNSSWSRSRQANKDIQPYVRGVKWSPDGTCCLTVVNNDGVHLFELPKDLYQCPSLNSDRKVDILDPVIHVKEAGLIYDFCWYPQMNSLCPETCSWITTRQNGPIQMWDAYNGSLRCTYRGFNSVDEMEPALSVTFTPDGTKIIAGYKKNMLRTFDVDRPGRDFAEHKTSFPASCFATDYNIFAVGSWNRTVYLYSIKEIGTYKSIGKLNGHSGGVTHMKFTSDGSKLVSGARLDDRILVWDIRNFRRPLNTLRRVVDTAQRIYFDLSSDDRYLVTGSADGSMRVWDSQVYDWTSIDVGGLDPAMLCVKYPLHNDCTNSVSLHPLRPILASGSGQIHFEDPAMDSEDECQPSELQNGKYSHTVENALSFWWIGEYEEKMSVDTS